MSSRFLHKLLFAAKAEKSSSRQKINGGEWKQQPGAGNRGALGDARQFLPTPRPEDEPVWAFLALF